MTPTAPLTGRLRAFVDQLGGLPEWGGGKIAVNEAALLTKAEALLADLVAEDDWLDDAYAQPHPTYYRQYLLHLDPEKRFSVVSFVWGPGQETPIHNHETWGAVGMLRGAEISQSFEPGDDGLQPGDSHRLEPGDVLAFAPASGDIHQVRNALTTQTSISIHVYGGDIGAVQRKVFTRDGQTKPFQSGYSEPMAPTPERPR